MIRTKEEVQEEVELLNRKMEWTQEEIYKEMGKLEELWECYHKTKDRMRRMLLEL